MTTWSGTPPIAGEAEELGGAVHRADEETVVRAGVQTPGLARHRKEELARARRRARPRSPAGGRRPSRTREPTSRPPRSRAGERAEAAARTASPCRSRCPGRTRGARIGRADEAAPEDDRLSVRKGAQTPVSAFGGHGGPDAADAPDSDRKRWIWKLRAASRLTTRRLPSGSASGPCASSSTVCSSPPSGETLKMPSGTSLTRSK